MCKKEMPKKHKALTTTHMTLVQNAKKASLMVQKEVKKKASKVARPIGGQNARAKKLMKEVLYY